MRDLTGKASGVLKAELLQAMRSRSDTLLGRNKAGRLGKLLLDRVRPDDLTEDLLATMDCSEILDTFCAIQSIEVKEYVRRYIEAAQSMGLLDEVFDHHLMSHISRESGAVVATTSVDLPRSPITSPSDSQSS
jgi:hypothetical protein